MVERLIRQFQPCPACKAPNTLSTYRDDEFGDEVDRCSCCKFEGVRLNLNAREMVKKTRAAYERGWQGVSDAYEKEGLI
jgi:Zn ribbon nucleic-acid-binding protein